MAAEALRGKSLALGPLIESWSFIAAQPRGFSGPAPTRSSMYVYPVASLTHKYQLILRAADSVDPR